MASGLRRPKANQALAPVRSAEVRPAEGAPAAPDGMTPRQRFDRRRRRVNLGVLAMLVLFCVLFYAISMVKLAHYGLAWIE
jgi:hypothetical protein